MYALQTGKAPKTLIGVYDSFKSATVAAKDHDTATTSITLYDGPIVEGVWFEDKFKQNTWWNVT